MSDRTEPGNFPVKGSNTSSNRMDTAAFYPLEAPIVYRTTHATAEVDGAAGSPLTFAINALMMGRFQYAIENLGLNLNEIFADNLGFYVTNLSIENTNGSIDLKRTSQITIESYIAGVNETEKLGTRFLTKFKIFGDEDKPFFDGCMRFVAVDIRNSRPVIMPPKYWSGFSSHINANNLSSIIAATEFEGQKAKTVQSKPPTEIFSYASKVKNSELDLFKHVSSGFYAAYVTEGLERAAWSSSAKAIREFSINYRRSLRADDPYEVRLERSIGEVKFSIVDPSRVNSIYASGLVLNYNNTSSKYTDRS
ncbi:MAG: hypothetical protein H6626_10910 [Pseudobdellovibrionaceae bacterium]|nr:MAG: hypothetical protein H6626_10910 [Pseudobdellovibrionaceae bacterium]